MNLWKIKLKYRAIDAALSVFLFRFIPSRVDFWDVLVHTRVDQFK